MCAAIALHQDWDEEDHVLGSEKASSDNDESTHLTTRTTPVPELSLQNLVGFE